MILRVEGERAKLRTKKMFEMKVISLNVMYRRAVVACSRFQKVMRVTKRLKSGVKIMRKATRSRRRGAKKMEIC